MKESFTLFGCDNCKERIRVTDGEGFPYKDGWVYMNRLNMKGIVIPDIKYRLVGTVQIRDEQDKHFCCKECAKEFMFKFISKNFGLDENDNPAEFIVETNKELMEKSTTSKVLFGISKAYPC